LPKNVLKRIFIIAFISLSVLKISAQSNPVFQHLNTSNGLSYLGVSSMCTDKKGNLWIGTGNGLNMFNGKTVEKYFATEYPALQNSNVLQVVSDSSDRIWVLTAGGHVTMLDEKRQMRRVSVYEQNEYVKTLWILNSGRHGITLFTTNGNYVLRNSGEWKKNDSLSKQHFDFLPLKGFFELNMKGRSRVFAYDEEYYLLMHPDAFVKVKYSTNTVEKKYDFPGLTGLIKWQEAGLLAYDRSAGEIKSINLVTEEITYPFRGLKDQHGLPVKATFNFCGRLSNDRYIFTTTGSGLYIFDAAAGKIFNYRHHIADPYSVSNDHLTTLTIGQKGWVFVTCIPNGISYFNADDFIGRQNVFIDDKGKGYDGYVQAIATKDNNSYYLGTGNGLLEWKRNTGYTEFIDVTDKKGNALLTGKEITSIVIDNQDRVWVATIDDGIIVLDRHKKLTRYIKREPGNKKSLKVTRISRLKIGPDGYIWVCGRYGLCRIDPGTFEIDNFENTPLQQLDSLQVVPLHFSDQNNLWIATAYNGLYHYNMATREFKEFTAFSSIAAEGIYDFIVDRSGVVYIANARGLKIYYPDGRMKNFTQKEGLLIDRAEGILFDDHDRVWIGNDIGLVCYNPADSSLRAFDVRYGLTIYGFRVGSYFRTPNGEFMLGTPKGIQYFHPESLYNKKITLNVHISKIETEKISAFVGDNSSFSLSAKDNQVTFYFSSVDYSPHLRTFYECRLSSIDKDWVKIADQNSIRYNSLPPGKYIFNVRVSSDNLNWQDADNAVTIKIAIPFYGTWWFKAIAMLVALGLIWFVIRYYQKKQRLQREELETELVINYFASQINSRYRTDELLWDVAKNLIGKLGFEDCMIYLWNDDKTVLVQKAGYGSKGSMQSIMDKAAYHIPSGKGIVGAAVESKHSVLVNDTSKDKRYFTADGKIMLSELCVPLVHDNEVLGAINTEHQQKNFFTAKHQKMLSTIAVLCANQVQRIRAEEEKQQARIEALQNKQKATETRLQSLRLQMNPHFLFNALNSIQQMILANEDMVATKYLSKFSKLLRTILVQSDKEMATLKEELEILNLYVELEAIRFKESFQYTIACDEEIDQDELKVPTLLIQPFVENAIWHGLMHKEGKKILTIQFFENKDFLHCIIEDNGVGREKAREVKMATGRGQGHTSKGIQVSLERLKKTRNANGNEGSLTIIDLKNTRGGPSGTRVEINFPIQN
jgi:ligand-binding sensor domain-containing protein/putative methionine-R-sulfoxide reductase with GAF domain/anti-sigma regulatory factor (Ser/Thr protein kinase)